MKILQTYGLLFTSFLLSACGSSSVDNIDVPGVSINGYISKGPVTESDCILKGESGDTLSPSVKSTDGHINFSDVKYEGTYVSMECIQGTYTDESTGNTRTLSSKLRGADIFSEIQTIVISPFTEAAYRAGVGSGKDQLANIVAVQNPLVASNFGLKNINIVRTIPTDITKNVATYDAAGRYGTVLAGFAHLQVLQHNQTISLTIDFLNTDNNAEKELQASIGALNSVANTSTQVNTGNIRDKVKEDIGFNIDIASGHNKISVNLKSFENAASYQVCWSTSSNITEADCTTQSATFNSAGNHNISHPSITNGTEYYVIILVQNSSGATLTKTLTAKAVTPNNPFKALNDTGIIISGNYPTGNNSSCLSASDTQDCHTGRDSNTSLSKTGGGHAGFDFSKINALGNIDESLDTSACVKDNQTGLTWEIKQSRSGVPKQLSDGSPAGLHHGDDKFTWYVPVGKNGGNIGSTNPNSDICFGYSAGAPSTYCNTNTYITKVNNEAWCGISNWRLPTRTELMSIINYSKSSALDFDYFKNIRISSSGGNSEFWTSTPAMSTNSAWQVEFFLGYVNTQPKSQDRHIMLVSSP